MTNDQNDLQSLCAYGTTHDRHVRSLQEPGGCFYDVATFVGRCAQVIVFMRETFGLYLPLALSQDIDGCFRKKLIRGENADSGTP